MDEQRDADFSSLPDSEADEFILPVTTTFEEAKKRRTELINELRTENADDRLAYLMAKCHKGRRCNLDNCPVCERRKLIAKNVPASIVKMLGSLDHPMMQISVDAIKIVGKRRPLNEQKLRVLTASIREIGLQTPISVRKRKKDVVLIAGRHRLEAVKRLSWDRIPCLALVKDDIDLALLAAHGKFLPS
jgi:hypothetical protein